MDLNLKKSAVQTEFQAFLIFKGHKFYFNIDTLL